jgi:nucleotide-binding universal stress UspA family protein
MNSILIPLDGSALAEQILPYARALALHLDTRIRLLRVVPDPEPDSTLADGITGMYGMGEASERQQRQQRALEDARANAEGYLVAQAGRLAEYGIDVEIDVRVGSAADNIVEAAASLSPRLIAMATHGYSGLRRWALGSVADRVVHATPVPVLLVRGSEHPPAPSFSLRRILVPLDGSGLSRQALPLASELSSRARADVVLFQSVAPSPETYPSVFGQPTSRYSSVLAALHEQASRELEALTSELRREDVTVTTSIAHGYAAEAIVDEAARRGASVIVMASHGRGGIRRWALGSVADKVLHATTTPLLLVRAG